MMNETAASPIEAVGEQTLDIADAAAKQGIDGLRSLLEFQLLHTSNVTITVGSLLAAVLVMVGTLLVSALVQRALGRYGKRTPSVNQASLYTLNRVVHYLLLAAGLLLALEVLGMSVTKFAVLAGGLGVGLGFGLQAIFNNFVSGLILLFDKSLKVGDFVELEAGTRGMVKAINIRATLITTNDNIDILVPNSEFVSGRVVNWTHRSANRRIRVPFGVAYGTDKELVKKAALEAAARVPFTLAMEGPEGPQVWLDNFGDSAVEFILAVWLTEEAARRNAAIRAAYLWELDTSLKEHGIEIPFPQRDLHIRSAFGRHGEAALAAFARGAAAPGDDTEDAAPALAREEREALSSNDATLDVQQGGVDAPASADREQTPDTDARDR